MTVFLSGNEACVEGALLAGCKFFAGYPISPSTEILELMAKKMPKAGGYCLQVEDEIAAICAVIGASWGGLKAMTATSGPGFSLMQEAIGYAVITETPCVIVNVQRGGPSTGQPTFPSQSDIMQARYGTHGDYEIIALTPSSVQEVLELTVEAFNFSEMLRVPVILLSDALLAHMREVVHIPSALAIVDRKKAKEEPERYLPYKPEEDLVPPMACFGEGYDVIVDGLIHDERGYKAAHLHHVASSLQRRLCDKILRNIDRITRYEEGFLEGAKTVVICYGISARSSIEAVKRARRRGVKVGYLKLKTLWPLNTDLLHEKCKESQVVIVPEMNVGKLAKELKAVLPQKTIISCQKLGGLVHNVNEILAVIEKCPM